MAGIEGPGNTAEGVGGLRLVVTSPFVATFALKALAGTAGARAGRGGSGEETEYTGDRSPGRESECAAAFPAVTTPAFAAGTGATAPTGGAGGGAKAVTGRRICRLAEAREINPQVGCHAALRRV